MTKKGKQDALMARSPDRIFLDELSCLSRQHQFVFCASCCERLYPLYKLYLETIGSEESQEYRKCLNDVWEVAVVGLDNKQLTKDTVIPGEEDDSDEPVVDLIELWAGRCLGILSRLYEAKNEISLDFVQGQCLDCISSLLSDSGVWIESDFEKKSSSLYWGYHDQPEMLREFAVQFEILKLLQNHPLDEVSVGQVRKYSEEHPVLNPFIAREFLGLGQYRHPISQEVRSIISLLWYIKDPKNVLPEIEEQVVQKLTFLGMGREVARNVWGNIIHDCSEPVQEYLVSACLALGRMPMLEYIMHRLADWRTDDAERGFALKMIASCSPASEHIFRSDAHKPSLPPIPLDQPAYFRFKDVKREYPNAYFITAILDALDLLATIPEPEIPWLIRRYVDFPISEVAEHAEKCLEKRKNLWSMDK